MKKLMMGLLCLMMLVACKPTEDKKGSDMSGKKKVTVTTSFLADMTEVLAGDYVNIELVIPAGEDPHTYEAKPEDSQKLLQADLVLYHGLHFEGKMVEMLEAVKGVAVTRNFDKSKIGQMEEDGHVIIDPHFWFDTDLYKLACEEAAKALANLLPQHQEEIQKNYENYAKQLDELKAENVAQLATIPEESRILITPHDAFNYFSRAYGITVKAPQGVSTDAELSTKDMAETADFIVKHKVKAIFAESTTDPIRMEKLKESCAAQGFTVKVVRGEGQELFSDSLAPKGQKGDSYLEMVRHNISLIVSNLK